MQPSWVSACGAHSQHSPRRVTSSSSVHASAVHNGRLARMSAGVLAKLLTMSELFSLQPHSWKNQTANTSQADTSTTAAAVNQQPSQQLPLASTTSPPQLEHIQAFVTVSVQHFGMAGVRCPNEELVEAQVGKGGYDCSRQQSCEKASSHKFKALFTF